MREGRERGVWWRLGKGGRRIGRGVRDVWERGERKMIER